MMSIGGYVFGKLFQRHPMARGYAWKRDRGVCQICGRSAGHRENNFWVLHHWDYRHECRRPRLGPVWIQPVRRGGARDSGCIASVVQCVELPDCRTCSRESPEAFRACVSRVSVAHVRCNADYG